MVRSAGPLERANFRDVTMHSAAMRNRLSAFCVITAVVMLAPAPIPALAQTETPAQTEAGTQTQAEAEAETQTQTETEEPEQLTIYDADIEGRLGLDDEQQQLVEEILKESTREQRTILRKYGIDPMGEPRAILLIQAAGELLDLGRRTRRRLRPVLNGDQLAEYDRIIREVENRVREAVRW
jgi:hypothetical protein